MAEKVITAGDEVESWCTSCQLMGAHRVVAVVEGKPEKVICKTCERRHKYRPNPPKSRTKKGKAKTQKTTKKKKTTRTRRRKDPATIWEELLAEKDLSNPKQYAMSGSFIQHDIIEHKTFGIGLVAEVRAEGKMEVVFKEGTKLLACNR